MPICPAGHDSTATDFCDQCGAPLTPENSGPAAAVGAGEPDPATAAGSAPVALEAPSACPHCGSPKPTGALFCEACGYDYTTGALPAASLSTALGLPDPAPAEATPPASPEGSGDAAAGPTVAGEGSGEPDGAGDLPRDSGDNPRTTADQPADERDGDRSSPPDHGPDDARNQAEREPDQAPAQTDDGPDAGTPGQSESEPGAAPDRPEAPEQTAWVAEVWVDPDWHALQQAGDLLPPEGPPTTFPLTSPALIGRHSESRQIYPEVDCGADAGCSRRQAELSFASGRWTITDLGSANGTFVAPASAPLPETPLEATTPVGPDDRIYVGAWTRIVVRPAASGEIDALA